MDKFDYSQVEFQTVSLWEKDSDTVQVLGSDTFVREGYEFLYWQDSDGNVYAWGGSAKGKPGINSITNNPVPTVISSRLSVDVPDVAAVNFGDEPVMEFDVVGDETVQLLTPAALSVGEVPVTITDSEGTTVEAIQKYTYTQAAADLTPDAGGDEVSDGNDGSSTGDNQVDNNGDDNGKADNIDDDKDDQDGQDDDDSGSGNIAAPNTGIRHIWASNVNTGLLCF